MKSPLTFFESNDSLNHCSRRSVIATIADYCYHIVVLKVKMVKVTATGNKCSCKSSENHIDTQDDSTTCRLNGNDNDTKN